MLSDAVGGEGPGVDRQAAATSFALAVRSLCVAVRWRRRRSISATVFGIMITPRQSRLESSSTAQISASAGEAADHLGAPADLHEGALEEIRNRYERR
jgi:hypothetical protein